MRTKTSKREQTAAPRPDGPAAGASPLRTAGDRPSVHWAGLGLALAAVALLAWAAPAEATPGVGDAVAVDTSQDHTCVARTNGNVVCFGSTAYGGNGYGELNDYFGGDAVGVSTGLDHSCALRSNGNVACWGKWTDPYSGGDATALVSGSDHNCVLRSNRNVDCWGWNAFGQANDYTGGDAIAVAAGDYHTCIAKLGGGVSCWGRGTEGQTAAYLGAPALSIGAGGRHTCVLTVLRNVDCYGWNLWGQAADYTGGDAASVSPGTSHTCILKTNGNTHCWGETAIPDYNGGDAIAVAVGNTGTCILKASKNIDCQQTNDGFDYAVPLAPTVGTSVAGPNPGQVTVNWQPTCCDSGESVDDVVQYNVYRSTTSGGALTLVATVGDVRSFVDSGLGDGVTVYYKVTAISSIGESPYSSQRSGTTFSVPDPPYAPTASRGPGIGQIRITWPAAWNGGTTVTNYKVYRSTTSGAETFLADAGTSLSYTDSGLPDGARYYYKVTAVNQIGESALSSEATATAPTTPGAPQSPYVLAGPNAGDLRVYWSAGDNGGLTVTSFKVYRSDGAGNWAYLGTVSAAPYTDSGLGNGATHAYKVSAVNALGEGAQSVQASGTTFVPPGAPRNLAVSMGSNAGELRLTWQAPTSNGGSSVTAYKVYRGTASGSETYLTTLGYVHSFTDTGLGNGATRYYKVSAVNAAGEGVTSNEASGTTATPPGPPQGLAATAGPGAGEIRLTWQAPASNGGLAVTGYVAYRSASSGGPFTQLTTGGCANLGNVLTCTESGLGNGATFYYKVAAVNGAGTGSQSGQAGATTFVPPSAPQNLAASTDYVNQRVRLTWTAPASDGGTPVTSYLVYRKVGTGGTETQFTTGNQLSWNDTTCPLASTCYYQVVAHNVAGDGPRSNQASASGTKV